MARGRGDGGEREARDEHGECEAAYRSRRHGGLRQAYRLRGRHRRHWTHAGTTALTTGLLRPGRFLWQRRRSGPPTPTPDERLAHGSDRRLHHHNRRDRNGDKRWRSTSRRRPPAQLLPRRGAARPRHGMAMSFARMPRVRAKCCSYCPRAAVRDGRSPSSTVTASHHDGPGPQPVGPNAIGGRRSSWARRPPMFTSLSRSLPRASV